MSNLWGSSRVLLRAASETDSDDIAHVWHAAWGDGHRGHVPRELLALRTLAHFLSRVPPRISNTTLAIVAERVVGFVSVQDNELEQLFVLAEARGTGAARALLREGERRIAMQFDTAWLSVVAGNQRARRFYAREGWRDDGPIQYSAEIAGGQIVIDTHRYEKRVG
jgi:ribosomal protein S18 acetylase RimI-like enzyme